MNQTPQPSSTVATLFSRRVKSGHEEQYETWLAGISAASGSFPGSLGSTIVRPSGDREEYVTVLHFETAARLDHWLQSPERANWLAKLEDIPLEFEEMRQLTGLESCFHIPGDSTPVTPPRYKTALLVFLGLYPLVLGIGFVLDPWLVGLPKPIQVFLSLTVSVPLMVYFVLPTLTRIFRPWLQSPKK